MNGQTITNPGFEANAFTTFPGYISGAGNGPITGWTASNNNNAGLNPAAGSPFADNGATPEGTNVAFIQAGNSGQQSLSTTVTGLTVGTKYNVRFRINSRGGQAPWLRFSTDGTGEAVTMEVTSVGGTNPYKYAACEFTATAESQVITLTNIRTSGDHTVLLDDFSIASSSGAWAIAPWTNDADSGVDSQYVYTHAYSLGGSPPVTINGVRFIPQEDGEPGRFTLSGLTSVFNNGTNNLTGESYNLAKDFRYNGATGITLENLKPNTQYVFTLYGFGWDALASATPYRSATFESSLGGDRFTVNLNHYGLANGLRVIYTYTTDSLGSPVTISYPALGSGTFHTSGFSNREALPNPPSGAWTTSAWTDDASSGINGTYLYTHAFNFNSTTSFNVDGVNFTAIAGANPSGPGYSSTITQSFANDLNNNITGFGAVMSRDFNYNGLPQVHNLSGLTPGKQYVFTIYSTGFGPPDSRWIELFGNAADGPAWFDQNAPGDSQGIRFDYLYTADASGTVRIMASAANSGSTMHICGISNREAAPMVATAPVITLQPVGATLPLGTSYTLRAEGTGSGPRTYQWKLGTTNVPNGDGPVLELTDVNYADAGDYTLTITNGTSSATSNPATIVVRDNVAGDFNTGVGVDGLPLAGGAIDPHFTLVNNPHSPGSSTVYVQSGLPGTWLANSPTSKWIGPIENTATANGTFDAGAGPGVYVYRTQIDLTGFNLSTVTISGNLASDNACTDIRVNGVTTGLNHIVGNTFTYYQPIQINISNAPGLIAGVNIIDFVVQNGGNGYTGLRIDGLTAIGQIPAGTSPLITVQPVSTTGAHRGTAVLAVGANGSAPLAYQWYDNDVLMPGEIEPTLYLPIDDLTYHGHVFKVNVSNGSGNLDSLSATLTIPNAAPVPGDDAGQTDQGVPLQFLESELLLNDSDPDLDLLELTGVEASSAHGGTVSLVAGVITYTPAPGFHGADSFHYTVTDGIWGGSSSGTVNVTVIQTIDPAPVGFEVTLAGGIATATFTGAPGSTYTLLRSTTLETGSWTIIDSDVAPPSGAVELTDPAPPAIRAFYRISYTP